jgi:hypothetical protein
MIVVDHVSYKMNIEQMEQMLTGVTVHENGYVTKEKYEPLHGSM